MSNNFVYIENEIFLCTDFFVLLYFEMLKRLSRLRSGTVSTSGVLGRRVIPKIEIMAVTKSRSGLFG